MNVWVSELLNGTLRLFAQPLLYYAFALALSIGWLRIKRERKHFHFRVYPLAFDVRALLFSRSWFGIVLSIVTIGVGIVLPPHTVWLWTIVTVLCSLLMAPRFLSAAYTGSIVMFAVTLFAHLPWSAPFFARFFPDVAKTNVTALALLIALLLFIEAWLISSEGGKKVSPTLTKSKRGFVIGEQVIERLWIAPLFVLVPSGLIASFAPWWPLFSNDEKTYALTLVPFVFGFAQRVQTASVVAVAKKTSKQLLIVASFVFICAAASYSFSALAIVAAVVAFIGREWVALSVRLAEQQSSPHFTKRMDGLVIVGVLPNTPADKMALSAGEVIVKVNGVRVATEAEFYEALHRNRAFCKLEVLNERGDVRFAQGALFEGEHHELGLLFVRDEG